MEFQRWDQIIWLFFGDRLGMELQRWDRIIVLWLFLRDSVVLSVLLLWLWKRSGDGWFCYVRARGDKESSGDGSDIWLSPGIIVCVCVILVVVEDK